MDDLGKCIGKHMIYPAAAPTTLHAVQKTSVQLGNPTFVWKQSMQMCPPLHPS